MADKSKATEGADSFSRTVSENKLKQQPKQPDLTLGKAPLERGERAAGLGSRRFSTPVTKEEREASARELKEMEAEERIPSILHSMPIRRDTSPDDRPYPLSRESVSPIGYPPEPMP